MTRPIDVVVTNAVGTHIGGGRVLWVARGLVHVQVVVEIGIHQAERAIRDTGLTLFIRPADGCSEPVPVPAPGGWRGLWRRIAGQVREQRVLAAGGRRGEHWGGR